MPLPRRRAPEAVYELLDLLKLASSAVDRARLELHGEAANLASRLAAQVTYLRGVSELLEHEATRAASDKERQEEGKSLGCTRSVVLVGAPMA